MIEQMETRRNIMLVVKSAEDSIAMQELLVSSDYNVVSTLCIDSNVVDVVSIKSPDVIVISLVSPTIEHLAIAKNIKALKPTPIIMFSGDSDEDFAEKAIESGIDSYVVDGFSVKRVSTIISVAIARFKHEQLLNSELEKAKASLLERKTVEKAKGILMRQRRVDEDTAYRMLRKQSMNQGRKMFDIAEGVISASELLS